MKHITKIFKHIAKRIWNAAPLLISRTFRKNISAGYRVYGSVMRKYGKNARLYLTATGSGDAYACGLYFNAFCRGLPKSEIPLYCVRGESGLAAAELLSIKTVEVLSHDDIAVLVSLLVFTASADNATRLATLYYHNMLNHTLIYANICGYKNLDFITAGWIRSYTGIPRDEIQAPKFDYEGIYSIFERFSLIPGRTVLLAPYAKGTAHVPHWFWTFLAEALEKEGFTVCTNCAGDERPVDGTKAVRFPLSKSVPFLEEAGVTVGNRSGFQDITESANCLKISIYHDYGVNVRHSLTSNVKDFFTLAVYGRADQYEFEYTRRGEVALINKLVSMAVEYVKGKGTCHENSGVYADKAEQRALTGQEHQASGQ